MRQLGARMIRCQPLIHQIKTAFAPQKRARLADTDGDHFRIGDVAFSPTLMPIAMNSAPVHIVCFPIHTSRPTPLQIAVWLKLFDYKPTEWNLVDNIARSAHEATMWER